MVFDIEAVFIYPWAIVFSDAVKDKNGLVPSVVMVEMLVFVGVILVGLAYAWRKGALEWGPAPRTSAEPDDVPDKPRRH